ncbi:YqzM family protein [Halalkalibacillus sediminis]|uniref:YqzM family protein n=1 Tax=Halalkalibacillus sediminis TaxID=2018042 RepID=A0A2I0QXI2_9BACI|nr:YqzM family protein [Halalkalibacillus sediminis]PKR79051.1 YqzM family protein [Halalkalibacillus sediminis]
MNEFEKDVQSKTNDVVDSLKGFTFSFLFFLIIFFIGTTMKIIGS